MAAAIAHGLQDKLYLGNLDKTRDWGHVNRLCGNDVDDPAAGYNSKILWLPPV